MVRDEQAILTNAPVYLYLFDENGQELEFKWRALDDIQVSELDEWLRARHLKTVYKSLDGIKDAALRAEILEAGNRHSVGISWMSPEGRKSLSTVDGMAKLTQLSVSQDSPNVTFEQMRKLMLNPANVQRAMSASAYAAGVDASASSAKKKKRTINRGRK